MRKIDKIYKHLYKRGIKFDYRRDSVPYTGKHCFKHEGERDLHFGIFIREVLHEDAKKYGRPHRIVEAFYIGATWDYPYRSERGSRSWKRNSKRPHQYAKHWR